MRRFLLCILIIMMLTSCTASPVDTEAEKSDVRSIMAMDTYMTLTVYGTHRGSALEAGEAEIHRLEALLSTELEDSEIATLNRTGTGTLSPDSQALIRCASELYQGTEGAFDITVYPLMELWGFPSGEHHVPEKTQLQEVLRRVGMDKLGYEQETGQLTLAPGQAVDLGGIAKGYTSQRLMEIYREMGVTSALVSLGGNVQCLGSRPDGKPWRVGIRDPWGRDGTILAVVEVRDRAVVTSGGYERYFMDEETGLVYRHILDPKTGWPAESGLVSVTVVSEDGMLADGLSTALYVMGLERATAYWRTHSDQFQAVFVDDDGQIFITEGLTNAFSSDADVIVLPLG